VTELEKVKNIEAQKIEKWAFTTIQISPLESWAKNLPSSVDLGRFFLLLGLG